MGLVLAAVVAAFWRQQGRDLGAAFGLGPTEADGDRVLGSGSGRVGLAGEAGLGLETCSLEVVALLDEDEGPIRGRLCISSADGGLPVGYANCQVIESAQVESVALPRSSNTMVWVDFSGFMARPSYVSTFVFARDERVCGRSVTFRLEPGSMTTGVVRDSVGGIVDGALIVSSAGITTSDDEGRFTLTHTKTWGFIDIAAHADGYAPAITHSNIGRRDLELFLAPESVVTGTIYRPNRTPLSGAAIRAEGSPAPSVTSALDGSFELHGLSPGTFQIIGVAPGLRAVSNMPISVEAGKTVEGLELLAMTAPRLQGTIELPDGSPCSEGGWVRLDLAAGESTQAQADLSGAFSFDELVPGRYTPTIGCAGFQPQGQPVLDVAADSNLAQRWIMHAGQGLRLMVYGAEGEPATGVQVNVLGERGNYLFAVDTGDNGLAEIQGLSLETIQVEIRDPDHGKGRLSARLEPAPGPRVSLTLERLLEGRIVGRVEFDGEPLGAGIRVVASGERSYLVTPGDEGEFELMVAPGDYRVYAHFGLRAETAKGAPSSEDVAVSVEDEQEVGPLALVLNMDRAEFFGRVESDDGSPVVNALVRVRAREDPFFRRETMTDGEGSFSLDRLVAGIDYEVDVYSPDGREMSAESLRPGSQQVLRLPPTKRVCGEVVDAEGAAIRDFEVTLFAGRSARNFHFSNAEGSWCLPEVGRAHKLLVRARGGMVTHAPVEGHLISEIAEEVGVRGRVLDPDGQGLRGAMLWLVDPASRRRVGRVATSGAEGFFDLVAPLDTLLLHVEPPSNGRYAMKELAVTGAERELVIILDAAG